mmetsp:Transcript_13990/g.30251  ORF Transcript_13990/g.30251 Transcript_13990/m.30251 type:complete len:201 (-) Transcript_13990:1066-1668(-)
MPLGGVCLLHHILNLGHVLSFSHCSDLTCSQLLILLSCFDVGLGHHLCLDLKALHERLLALLRPGLCLSGRQVCSLKLHLQPFLLKVCQLALPLVVLVPDLLLADGIHFSHQPPTSVLPGRQLSIPPSLLLIKHRLDHGVTLSRLLCLQLHHQRQLLPVPAHVLAPLVACCLLTCLIVRLTCKGFLQDLEVKLPFPTVHF